MTVIWRDVRSPGVADGGFGGVIIFQARSIKMRQIRNMTRKLAAFSMLLLVCFVGMYRGMVAQTVNGFRMPANPYYNPYTGPYGGNFSARSQLPNPYRTTPFQYNNSMAYRPPVHKPFANAPLQYAPLVSSQAYARHIILDDGYW